MHLRQLGFLCMIVVGVNVGMSQARADDALYQALGGEAGLTKIVDETIDLSLADKRISATFEDTNIPRLKQRITLQLCQLTGGPCQYPGRKMGPSHAHLHLTNAHFNAVVEDLQIAMDHAGIPFRTQNKLLAILAPMQRDVVTR